MQMVNLTLSKCLLWFSFAKWHTHSTNLPFGKEHTHTLTYRQIHPQKHTHTYMPT